MPDAKLALLSAACAALVLLSALPSAVVEEALETTQVTTVPAAIDQGASAALVGLLPTSEAHQRGTEVVAGLKSGAPTPGPSLGASQLETVAALAEGAVRAAVETSPSTPTSSADRAALRAFAKGYLSGALAGLPAYPTAGEKAVVAAQAKGALQAALAPLLAGDPRLSASQHEAYARGLASQAVGELDAHAATLVAVVGSAALADVAAYASDVVRAHLEGMPTSVATLQADAVGQHAGGILQGTAVGLAESFPAGVPRAGASDVQAWLDAVARGHEGTPPWSGQGSPELLAEYAESLARAGVTAIQAARADVSGASPAARVADLAAWGRGLASGGFERLGQMPATGGDLEDDVRAYAEALAAPGVDLLMRMPTLASADPDAVKAYAEGLTAGLDDVGTATTDVASLFRLYGGGLATAVSQFPADAKPEQVLVLEAFAEGVTDRAANRLSAVQSAALPAGDAELVQQMARGLADGAARLAQGAGPSGTAPVVGALGEGLASGFLQSRDPAAVWGDVDGLNAATRAWFANVVPAAAFGPLADAAARSAAGTEEAARRFGAEMGAAPVEWASGKGKGANAQAFATKNDLLWIASYAQETVNVTLPTVLHPEDGLNASSLERTSKAASAYAGDVAAAATALPIEAALRALTAEQVPTAAKRFADAAAAPIGWIHEPFVDETAAAAGKALADLTTNATFATRFVNGSYARGATALLTAIGDGVAERAEAERKGAHDRVEGGLIPAWTDGAVEAILAAPVPQVQRDVSDRALWLAAASGAAAGASSNATADQAEATKAYAEDVLAWVLAHDELPPLGDVPVPLAAWAEATVGRTLERAPPRMTDGERDAFVAYATGVAEAVAALPTPDALAWTPAQLAALDAWVGGVSAGAATVVADVQVLQDATTCQLLKKGCPPPPPCDDCPEPCETDCDPGEEEPECDDACLVSARRNATEALAQNARSWSENVTLAALEQMPDVSPTAAGLAALAAYAENVLAGHGARVDLDDPSLLPDGPRGPAWDFANARATDVERYAETLGAAYEPLAELEADPRAVLHASGALADPLTRWALAMRESAVDWWLDEDRIPRGEPGAPPESPRAPLPSSAEDAAVQAWMDGLWDAIPRAYADLLATPLPGAGVSRDHADHLDYVVFNAIARGGMEGASESARNATAAGRALTPQTGALDAFAETLVLSANATLVDPAQTDALALVRYLQGVAEGGVAAITAAQAAITDQQLPALQAYAAAVADAGWIPPPPVAVPKSKLSPDEGESDADDAEDEGPAPAPGGAPTQPPPDPKKEFLAAVQAHGAGLAEAVAAAPASALLAGPTAYAPQLAAYLDALQAAAAALPPASTDAGYAARVRAWASGEAHAALGDPPQPSPDRVAPHPDVALATAYLEALAATAPWALVDPAQATAAELAAWAQAATTAGLSSSCPLPERPQACAALGEAMGAGVGDALPEALPPVPDKAAYLAGLVAGAAAGLGGADRPGPDVARDAETVKGLVLAAVPLDPAVAEAISAAVAEHAPDVPLDLLAPLSEALAKGLATAPPADAEALAEGAVAAVEAALASEPDASPEDVNTTVRSFLDGNAKPSVSVTDGEATATGAELDGSPLLSALRGLTVSVVAPRAAPGDWSVRYGAGDAPTADWKAKRLAASGGKLEARLTSADLGTLPRGAKLSFLVEQAVSGQVARHDRGGKPFMLQPDREAPTATIDAPASTTSSSFTVSWSGDDDVRVERYHVQARDGAGAWQDWLHATTDRSASFTGAPGRSYAFRAFAIDAAGHEGAASADEATSIAETATGGGNRAPTVSFRAPTPNATYSGEIVVDLAASDPDGTEPQVRVCVREDGGETDLLCPHEGAASRFTIDGATLPDGTLVLHATATDGTLRSEARSAPFRVDRSPPLLRGVAIDFDGTTGTLSAGAADARSVEARLAGPQPGALALRETSPGQWSVQTKLAPGDYVATFVAEDAGGNAATMERAFRVDPDPVAPTGPTGSPPGGTATPPEGDKAPPPAKGRVPGPGLALVALAALAALALRRRA